MGTHAWNRPKGHLVTRRYWPGELSGQAVRVSETDEVDDTAVAWFAVMGAYG
ncbi:MAG: hypothetical protein M3228_07655 [Actinomycetota bacterium]|nr:hypothetical protein [Actinomycetota bacterium]